MFTYHCTMSMTLFNQASARILIATLLVLILSLVLIWSFQRFRVIIELNQLIDMVNDHGFRGKHHAHSLIRRSHYRLTDLFEALQNLHISTITRLIYKDVHMTTFSTSIPVRKSHQIAFITDFLQFIMMRQDHSSIKIRSNS